MKSLFSQAFQSRLWETVAALEDRSRIEVVVIVRQQSDAYADVPLFWAGVTSLLMLAFLVFSPWPFGNYTLYLSCLLTWFGVWQLLQRVTPLRRLLLSHERRERAVEVMGRALFNKGGIHHTREKTGLLVYVSVLEQRVLLLPDRGVSEALPALEWQQWEAAVQAVFQTPRPDEALLEQLRHSAELFGHYLPARPDDMNELPDDLAVEL